MPQSTNLNKTPYYDDFDRGKNFYKVLFKPGVTVQTRELTTLQSILQNQIEKFGSKFFNSGGVVIPGNTAYIPVYNAVEIETVYKGINVETYFNQILGKVVTGSQSGVKAKIVKTLGVSDSEKSSTTIYVKYLSTADDFEAETFIAGEELLADFDIALGAGFIIAGEPILQIQNPVGSSPFSIGSAAQIEEGVYFVRGYFVDVESQELILEQYSNTPSYRVGLSISEKIVGSNDDSSLNDNAQGFSNYAAPGADRFTIILTLSKKTLDDFNDDNFIELFKVENGIVKKIKQDTTGSFITDVLARRTFDESGNYTVLPYKVRPVESLDNQVDKDGIYLASEKTSDGSIPSDDLALIQVTPGKSYIKGYEVPTYDTLVDYPKPRTTQLVESSSIVFNGGDLLRVNNVTSAPKIGLTTNASVTLYARRLENNVASGATIGYARIYDFEHHNTSYENPTSQFNLKLFDIQTFTNLYLDTPSTGIGAGAYIQGASSGAAGYAKSVYDGDTKFSLYQVTGKFVANESLVINGISSTSSVIGTVTDYTINDVKALSDGLGFTADTLLSDKKNIVGPFNFVTYHDDPAVGGIATVSRVNGSSISSGLKIDDIVSYQPVGFNSAVYARIISFNTTRSEFTIAGVTTITNLCTGNIGVGTYSLESFDVIRPKISDPQNSFLYNELDHKNISNINLNNSSAIVKRQYTGVVKSGTTLTLPSLSGTDYTYAAFDEERYLVINADGSIENLTNATLTLTSGGKNAEFTSLSSTAGPCVVITSQIKSNVSAKKKSYVRCNSLIVSKTKYSTPKNAGLNYDTSLGVYGVRVDDDKISLNYPDIVQVHAVYEASGTADPVIPWLGLSNLNSPTSNTSELILGEYVVGKTSGAVAVYIEQKNSTQIYFAYTTEENFIADEVVEFVETGYTATIATVNAGDKNIINNYVLDNGQRKNYYDFGRLIRKPTAQEPVGRLKIYFDRFSFDSSDVGDIITVNSYLPTLYGNKIPSYSEIRNTDIIDIRPRVENYNVFSGTSPFEFNSRSFAGSGSNASQILASNESITFDYNFYLGRNDKLTLDKEGNFEIIFGEPSETPILPTISTEVLDVATIFTKPYVYDVEKDISIIVTDNKRYTMSDLRVIEDRVENLEYVTSLNFLEMSTESLYIEDANGLNRFKSGFFVDNFSDDSSIDFENPSVNVSLNASTESISPVVTNTRIDLDLYSTDVEIAPSEIDMDTTTSTNIARTGESLTLDYTEVEYTKQPFASRIVSVNPFDIITWVGNLKLTPSIDKWTSKTSVVIATIQGGGNRTQFVGTKTINAVYIRSRNIAFTANRLKPRSRFNVLFGSKLVHGDNVPTKSQWAFPKLVEISDVKGSFIVGETVNAYYNGIKGQFRICTPNHKSGPHNNPTKVYNLNPYNPTVGISSLYGPESTILNLDTETLSTPSKKNYYGFLRTGYKLYGKTSKATAKVSANRLISDEIGHVSGSVWIPKDTFKTGSTTVELTTGNPSVGTPEDNTSSSQAVFTSEGKIIQSRYIVYYDPLAQTFIVDEESGIVPTSIDLYFQNKDSSIPVEVQIRETVNGYPGTPDLVVPGLKAVLNADEVNISDDATVPTTFRFDNMVRLEGGKEYAIVIVSDSPEYMVWHSRMGDSDVGSANNPEIGKVVISKQPSLGVMFKAQNGSTWTASQEDDIKFTLRRADFSTNGGTVRLFNAPQFSQVPDNILDENPLYSYSTSADSPLNSGRHILVNHKDHGMHSPGEKVSISGASPDSIPTTLLVGYGATETGSVSVASTLGFDTYDGSPVGPGNLGYLIIGNEVMSYNAVLPNELGNISRAQFGTVSLPYGVGEEVYKYEFNNVPLQKINTTHTILSSPKPTLDSYYIQVGAGSTFSTEKFGGGSEVFAGKNANYNVISLNEDFIISPPKTKVTAKIRSVSQRSIDGSETGYVDQGYEEIDPFGTTTLGSLRTVASKVNEVEFLNSTLFEGQKSLGMELILETSDSKVSPIIDINQIYVDLQSTRINQPVGLSSYASDSRVNLDSTEPHAFVYVSKKINLEQSATSIKAFISCVRDISSDVRMLYKIYRPDVPDEDQTWELFPGYDNLDVNGEVINSDNNNGRSDLDVPPSIEGRSREYSFTVDNLPVFTGFAIKIVVSSTNQAKPPVLTQLRAIALA